MPQQGAQDKTEKPTPKRRQKARERGQVAKSQEINSVAVLMTGLGALYLMGGYLYSSLSNFMRHMMLGLDTMTFDHDKFHDFMVFVITTFLKTAAPVWLLIFVAAVLVNVAQVGFLLAPSGSNRTSERSMPSRGSRSFSPCAFWWIF